uniref:Uncharacterized protein n=1 Tax=Callorhinchus milii TaxID=7868 RepID=A0A4W3IJ76_CALMI
MKMKQLLLVDQMPTIFETFDELYQHDPSRRKEKERASESFTPQTQDDYLRSICHLAQPTFLCEIASRTPGSAHRSPKLKVNRRHQSDPASPVSSLRSSNKGKRLPSGTGVDRQHGAQGPASNVDPFAWLFGESCKENHQVSSQQGTQHRSPRDSCPREDRPLTTRLVLEGLRRSSCAPVALGTSLPDSGWRRYNAC